MAALMPGWAAITLLTETQSHMNMLFIGTDRFFAEGLRCIVEDMYRTDCSLSFVLPENRERQLLHFESEYYDLVAVDMMSVTPETLRIYRKLLSSTKNRRMYFIDSVINYYSSLKACMVTQMPTIHKNCSLSEIISEIERVMSSHLSFSHDLNSSDALYNSHYKKISNYELDIIKSLSSGEKVKSIAHRLNKNEKAIYHQLHKIKEKIGIQRKHDFLALLRLFHFDDMR